MFEGLTIDPVAFSLPFGENGFPVYWYGILITLGILLGSLWGAREVSKRGQSVDEFFNGLIIAVLSGYLFARITYVVLDMAAGNGARYDSAIDILNIRSGGANILGGFLGAGLITWLYVAIRRLDVGEYADAVGPTLLLAQGIGRWGNFINQELYGPPTTAAWGIPIEQRYRLSQFQGEPAETLFHPTFLYESIWLILGFIILAALTPRFRERKGAIFGMFAIWWGLGRAVLELAGMRPDQAMIGEGPVTYSSIIAIGLILFGIYLLLRSLGRIGSSSSGGRKSRPSKPKPIRS